MSSANPALAQFIRSIPLFSLVEDADLNDVLRLFRPVELHRWRRALRRRRPGQGDVGAWVKAPRCRWPPPRARTGRWWWRTRGRATWWARWRWSTTGRARAPPSSPSRARPIRSTRTSSTSMRGTFVPAAFKVLRKIAVDLCARLRHTNERIVPSGHSGIQTPALPPGPRPDKAMVDRYPAFKGLPAMVKLALAQKLEVIELTEMTPIFAEGEKADGAYFIVEGEVSVGRNGKTLANLPAGTMFGVVACIDAGLRSASCVATGPGHPAQDERSRLRPALRRGPPLRLPDRRSAGPPAGAAPARGQPDAPAPRAAPRASPRCRSPVEKMLPAEPSEADLDVISTELEVDDRAAHRAGAGSGRLHRRGRAARLNRQAGGWLAFAAVSP